MAKLVTILTLCIARTLAHQGYRMRIPNGLEVPNPCSTGQVWNAVGHMQPGSNFQQRNPFGQSFARHGLMWTPALCREDSDGDGIPNGEELGDPSCTWRQGSRPDSKPTGHPGICEPVGSPRCAAQAFSCGGSTQPRMPPGMQQQPQSPFQQPPQFQQPRMTFQQPPSPFQQPQSPFRQPQSPFQQPLLTQMQPRPQMTFQGFPPQMAMQPQPQGFPPQMQAQPQAFPPPPPMQMPTMRQQQPGLQQVPQMMMPTAAMQPGFPQMSLQAGPSPTGPRSASQEQAERAQSWFGQGRFANWFSDFFSQNRPTVGQPPSANPSPTPAQFS
ncbi:hypothetical protein ScPMuIL_004556 [Solemya velum]